MPSNPYQQEFSISMFCVYVPPAVPAGTPSPKNTFAEVEVVITLGAAMTMLLLVSAFESAAPEYEGWDEAL